MQGETQGPSPEEMELKPEDLSTEGTKPEPPQKTDSTEKFGSQFLHQKDSQLHTTPPIEKTQERRKAKGEGTSQKPADKIGAYLDRVKDILNPEPLKRDRDFDRGQRNIDFLKRRLYENVILKPEDIPESYYENQRRLAREQGHGDIEITDEMRSQLSEVIISDQKSTLDNWTDYLTSPDSDSYPMWAKYWAYTGMLKLSTYDKEKHAFGKRDKDTVAPFPDLNREALAYVVDIVVKKINEDNISDTEDNPELQKLLQGTNFGKLYAYAIEKVTPTEENELTNTQGEWVKYPQDSDHMPLVNSLQGHGTGWCTAGETTAQSQLEGGDFHVYYSYDQQGKPTIPRVAIRMKGPNIGEVRGIAHEQNLDPYIGDVLDKKLTEFADGQAYQKKSTDMKHLTQIEGKRKYGEELTREDLRFLYEFDANIEGFGFHKDPRTEEILANRDIKSDISHITDYAREQISTTKEEVLKGGIKFHCGSLDLRSLRSVAGLQMPETVRGDLDLSWLPFAEGLQLPKTVKGKLSLSSLESVADLQLPKTVGGGLDLRRLTYAKGVQLPKTVGGYLNLNSLKSAVGLQMPETVGGDLYLVRLLSARGLQLPETVRGRIYLDSMVFPELQALKSKYPDLHIPFPGN